MMKKFICAFLSIAFLLSLASADADAGCRRFGRSKIVSKLKVRANRLTIHKRNKHGTQHFRNPEQDR